MMMMRVNIIISCFGNICTVTISKFTLQAGNLHE